MKRNPLWMSAAIACLLFMALLSIGAGVREVWNPGPTFLYQTTGPVTNTASGGYANYQSAATGTNINLGYSGFGTNSPQARIHVGAIGCTTAAEGIQFGDDVNLYRSAANTLYTFDTLDAGVLKINGAGVATYYAGVSGERDAGTITWDGISIGSALGGRETGGNYKKSIIYYDGSQYRSALEVTNSTGFSKLKLMRSGGVVGIGTVNPLATLDVNGGVNIGATAYDPGANNLTVQGTVGVAGLIRMTNSTDVAVDPAATTGVQWQSTGGWEYRNSVASEGAGQINRVHNRAAQVVGVGTDYTLTQTMTNIVFGTSGGAITLPSAGTYVLNALANHVGGNANDVTHWRLYDTNSLAQVPGSYQVHTIHANGDVDITPSHAIYTSTGSVVIALQAMNVTAARGTVTSTNTTISYMRCY